MSPQSKSVWVGEIEIKSVPPPAPGAKTTEAVKAVIKPHGSSPVPIVYDDSLGVDTNGQFRMNPTTGKPEIAINPNRKGKFPEDAIVQHELQHYELHKKGVRDKIVHEILSSRKGFEYALSRYETTRDQSYLEYAKYQANKHNSIKLVGVDSEGKFTISQAGRDVLNAISGNSSGSSFISLKRLALPE